MLKFYPGLLLFLFSCGLHAQVVPGCGSLENHYGPFDYTNPQDVREHLNIVERFHFNDNVKQLKGGAVHGNSLLGDINYILRAFPNHHVALYTIIRYRMQHPRQPGEEFLSAECYLKRAVAFKRSDGVVWMIYGIYHHKKGEFQKALEKYQQAEKLLGENSELEYNMGLLYFEMKQYDKSLVYARKAYAHGNPFPALREKLKSVGKWHE